MRACHVDLGDGRGQALGSALYLSATDLHLNGGPTAVGHGDHCVDLVPVGVAIVVQVPSQGLGVDQQIVDGSGLEQETECRQVCAEAAGVSTQRGGSQCRVRRVVLG